MLNIVPETEEGGDNFALVTALQYVIIFSSKTRHINNLVCPRDINVSV